MGLAVVHGIISSHQGTIQIQSRIGKGTTVVILLPEAGGDADLDEDPASGIPQGTEQILLIDDEAALAALEKQRLQRLGYSVTARTSPLEALELFTASPGRFDLVITDMSMPEMSGYSLIQAMSGVRPDIPFILCTGHADTLARDPAETPGAAGFLAKPHDTKSLAQLVRAVLDNRKTGQDP